MIQCACGCGEALSEYCPTGAPRRFIAGHGRRKPPEHVPKRILLAPKVLCGCGCGQTLPAYNQYGNKQRYIYGHVPNRLYSPVEPPPMQGRSENKDAKRSRESRWAKKIAVLRHYCGGADPTCACCGERHPQFLALDHVNRDGGEHRRSLGLKGGYQFYTWVVKQGFPAGFRVLCHNCNMAVGIWGTCPHQTETENAGQNAGQKG